MMSARRASWILRAAAAAALLFGVGCATLPERDWEDLTFEFPYVHDYDVANHASFVWRDDFLSGDSAVYDQRLAGPCSALAACVYGYGHDMDARTLTGMGFNAASLYRRYGADLDYADPVYGRDQVGFTLAVKRVVLDGCLRDVLFVLVRGTYGRDEWLSNMNVCNTPGRRADFDAAQVPFLHEGFARAADAVQAAAEAYAASNGVVRATAKVVVTGHSRGAAVANLLGARLDDGTFLSGVRPGNVFVYTFAAPNTVLGTALDCTAPRYRNIFNVVNPEDMVPLVPITSWSARRYGRDLFLKHYDALSTWEVWTDPAYNEMKDEFRAMTGYEWWHTPFGTNSTHLVPSVLGAVAPTLPDLYLVTPDQRASGNFTSVHSLLEMLIFRSMDPATNAAPASLGKDVKSLTTVYSKVNEGKRSSFIMDYLYTPDGRDFSHQPGIFDISWRLSCMHATQTYIGWMKAAETYGPAAVYKNWSVAGERAGAD